MAYTFAERLMRVGIESEPAKLIAAEIAGSGVTSVNTQTGDVVLGASDVGAVPVPSSPPAYSEVAEDLAAALVAAGLMQADE